MIPVRFRTKIFVTNKTSRRVVEAIRERICDTLLSVGVYKLPVPWTSPSTPALFDRVTQAALFDSSVLSRNVPTQLSEGVPSLPRRFSDAASNVCPAYHVPGSCAAWESACPVRLLAFAKSAVTGLNPVTRFPGSETARRRLVKF